MHQYAVDDRKLYFRTPALAAGIIQRLYDTRALPSLDYDLLVWDDASAQWQQVDARAVPPPGHLTVKARPASHHQER